MPSIASARLGWAEEDQDEEEFCTGALGRGGRGGPCVGVGRSMRGDSGAIEGEVGVVAPGVGDTDRSGGEVGDGDNLFLVVEKFVVGICNGWALGGRGGRSEGAGRSMDDVENGRDRYELLGRATVWWTVDLVEV